jgi:hypothetical protein
LQNKIQGLTSLKALEICSSPEPLSLRGNLGGKRKPKNASSPGMERIQVPEDSETTLPLVAAVDLLDATVNSVSGINNGKNFGLIVQTIQEIVDSAIKSGGSGVSDSSTLIVRCVHLWALHTLRNVSLSQETGGLSGAENMSKMLKWARNSLVSSLTPKSAVTSSSACGGLSSPGMKCPPRSKVRQGTPIKNDERTVHTEERTARTVLSLVGPMLQAILFVLSDAVLMRVSSSDVCDFILHLCGVLSVCPPGGMVLNVLKSALTRIQMGVQSLGGDGERVGERIEKLYSSVSLISSHDDDDEDSEGGNENNENEFNDNNENKINENQNYSEEEKRGKKVQSSCHPSGSVGSVALFGAIAMTPKRMTSSPDRVEDMFTALSL